MARTKLFFILIIITASAGTLMRVHISARSSSLLSYDPHFEYSQELRIYYTGLLTDPSLTPAQKIGNASFSAFRKTSGNREQWSPPSYHVLTALITALSPARNVILAKAFTLLCNLLTIGLLFLLLRHFFADDHGIVLAGLALLVFLPGNILFANIAINDVLFVPACTLFLLLCLKWQDEPLTWARATVLGLLCAFLLLTKYTGLICLVFLNALLVRSCLRRKAPLPRCAGLALLTLLLPLVLTGWFYLMNYAVYGTPLYATGVSPVKEHSFLSFRFVELLLTEINMWHRSDSVLTGFFASFFSFDMTRRTVQALFLRNIVFCLALAPSLVTGIGIIASVRKRKYLLLNVFFLIALASIVKFASRYHVTFGLLKSSYIMFLAPVFSVYCAEGCSTLRSWNKALFYAALAALSCFAAAVVVYYYGFFVA